MVGLVPGINTTLAPNTHYIIGVTTLYNGVTYSLTFWRDGSPYVPN